MSEREYSIENHPDYEPEPGFFDEDDDEPGGEDSAPVPLAEDDVAGETLLPEEAPPPVDLDQED